MRASPAKGSSVPLRASPGAPRVATALLPSRRRRARAAGSPRVAAQPGLRETLRLRPDAALRPEAGPGWPRLLGTAARRKDALLRRGCSARGRQQVVCAPRPPAASRVSRALAARRRGLRSQPRARCSPAAGVGLPRAPDFLSPAARSALSAAASAVGDCLRGVLPSRAFPSLRAGRLENAPLPLRGSGITGCRPGWGHCEGPTMGLASPLGAAP